MFSVDYLILAGMVLSVIICSGFLSFSESAILSLNKNKFSVHKKKQEKKFSTRALNRVLKNKNNYISTIIILNTIVNIGGSIVIGGYTAELFKNIAPFEIADGRLFTINAIFTLGFTFLILYFAEMIPKLLAAQNPLKWALFVAPVLVFFQFLIKPLIWISALVCKPFVKPTGDPNVCLIEVRTMIREAHKFNLIKDREMEIINNTLKLNEKTVRDFMKCKTKIEQINADSNILDVKDAIVDFDHSRVVVTQGENDEHPTGVVVVKDLLVGIIKGENKKVKEYAHEILIVKESDTLSHVLADFNETLDHLALVQCDDGSYLGILAVEDILDTLSLGFSDD